MIKSFTEFCSTYNEHITEARKKWMEKNNYHLQGAKKLKPYRDEIVKALMDNMEEIWESYNDEKYFEISIRLNNINCKIHPWIKNTDNGYDLEFEIFSDDYEDEDIYTDDYALDITRQTYPELFDGFELKYEPDDE